jgi:hypothetical protein
MHAGWKAVSTEAGRWGRVVGGQRQVELAHDVMDRTILEQRHPDDLPDDLLCR